MDANRNLEDEDEGEDAANCRIVGFDKAVAMEEREISSNIYTYLTQKNSKKKHIFLFVYTVPHTVQCVYVYIHVLNMRKQVGIKNVRKNA